MRHFQKITITVLFVLTILGVHGQINDHMWSDVNVGANSLSTKPTGDRYYLGFVPRGSHFYHSQWCEGYYVLEDGSRIEDSKLRYNSYTDELIVFNPRISTLITADKYSIKEFVTIDQQGVKELFRKMVYNKFPKGDRYFKVLYEGNNILLQRLKTEELHIGMYVDNSGIMRDSEFKLIKSFYIYTSDQKYFRIYPKRKSFYALFPENKKQIRKLFRQNHIDPKNEDELIRTVRLLEVEGILK